jgi:threonine/homoserine/homoserine lactone efflux protein
VLALVAVLSLRALRRSGEPAAPPPGSRLFLRFLALTSVNPLTVAYFAALIAGLPAVASAPAEAKAVFVLAAGAASLSWQLVLAVAGATLHRRLPPSARVYTALAGNALVLGLAAHMALAA